MLSYYSKWIKETKSKKSDIKKTKNRKTMVLFRYAVYDSKKFIFLKYHETSGLLSKLGIRSLLSKILLLGYILF